MRVLLLTHSYQPEVTAPQRRWGAFVGEFRRRGWECDVVTPVAHPGLAPASVSRAQRGTVLGVERGGRGEWIRRVPLIHHTEGRLSKLASNLTSAVLMVPRALTAPRPDVVVVTVPALPNIAAGYAVARLRRSPLVVDMRDAWPDLARDAQIVTSSRPGLMERVLTFVQRRADLVVTVTEGFADVLRGRGARRVETVYNGFPADQLPAPVPSREPVAEPLRVLYLGNHGESQGLEKLIDAARLAGDRVRLRLVGNGARKAELEAYARRTGADVDFQPPSHGEETLAHYTWADTCVVSLRDDWRSFEWTIPSKTYELLAIGKHITAVVRGEAARLLEGTGAADVVAPDPDAIAALWQDLADRPQRLAVPASGRAWVAENCDLRRLGRRYADLIETLTRGNPAA
ncbi:glycosyltransferase family 4 protein [Zhihengliuella sp.]|uniref:glycosyltransferase family 4 protein n=1 Tax=Zhihengliuella sp. TaxID=1954483 RepID=UPI002810F0DB|nr:glycosyltransferase family 4 protein [Zhihengliuella sp.]